MKRISKLSLKKYRAIAFDWDGTLVDSLGMYRELDRVFVENFYGKKEPIDTFVHLSHKIKTGAINNSENDYYRRLDILFGSGKTDMDIIWKNIYKTAPKVQVKIDYKPHAHLFLLELKKKSNLLLAIVTSSGMKDILFFSSDDSVIGKKLKPVGFFDEIITFDDVKNPKPHPESYQFVAQKLGLRPFEILVIEDALSGVTAAKKAGMDVLVINDSYSDNDRDKIRQLADYEINNWLEAIELL